MRPYAIHAAVFVLAGWYLMLPASDQNAPLGSWPIANTFERESDCEASRKEFFAVGTKRMQNAKSDQERCSGCSWRKRPAYRPTIRV